MTANKSPHDASPQAAAGLELGALARMIELFARTGPDAIRADGVQLLPPGPGESYNATEDLLEWMRRNFERYGDVYQTSLYGQRVYVINSPEAADHVLLRNWRNYPRKGQAVKRIALSLGNSLISSNGDVWARQRRMIQPGIFRCVPARQRCVARQVGERGTVGRKHRCHAGREPCCAGSNIGCHLRQRL